jgi:uncharacterized protein YqhQ
MRTGNFNIHLGFVRFAIDGLFDSDLRVAFSLVFLMFLPFFFALDLFFLADVFLLEIFFTACIRIAMRRSISASIKLARCLANVCSVDLTSNLSGSTEVGVFVLAE